MATLKAIAITFFISFILAALLGASIILAGQSWIRARPGTVAYDIDPQELRDKPSIHLGEIVCVKGLVNFSVGKSLNISYLDRNVILVSADGGLDAKKGDIVTVCGTLNKRMKQIWLTDSYFK